MAQIDPGTAQDVCSRSYEKALALFTGGSKSPIEKFDSSFQEAFEKVFSSSTQSYREALLGCAVAKVCTPGVNVTKPYLRHGEGAFSGRTLDEKVINRFLRTHQIPCSKGAYLATFRRSVKFIEETVDGLRDKEGYMAMLVILNKLKNGTDPESIVDCLMYGFIELRDKAKIDMMITPRISVLSLPEFLRYMLSIKSGGQIPMLVAEAFFRTINAVFRFGWSITAQGINEADSATHALGDITIIRENGNKIGVEITERPIDDSRVRDTYITKIALDPAAKDYIFIHTGNAPTESVSNLAKIYYQQGCNISFVDLVDYIMPFLITEGDDIVAAFLDNLRSLIKDKASANIKAAWNDSVVKISGL